MIVTAQKLLPQLQQKIRALYVLTGQEHYFQNEAAVQIKQAWKSLCDSDQQILDLNLAADWHRLIEEANSYSLLASHQLLDVRLDKKSLEVLGKKTLQDYLQRPNSQALILLRAPNIPTKQWQWLTSNEHAVVVNAVPLNAGESLHWLRSKLNEQGFTADPETIDLIQKYTQGNLLATAQMIEKLTLIYEKDCHLTQKEVLTVLDDQSVYQSYELSDAYLSGHKEKALHFLHQAYLSKMESTWVLWLLTQEIRQLIRLSELQAQLVPWSTACSQLNIWPKRAPLYQKALKQLSLKALYGFLKQAHQLDLDIKSGQTQRVWQGLQQLVLGF